MSMKQQHYRRLMKEQKSKATATQKIEHPLAKYNSLGQLICVVCTTQIKNELLWNTHLQSRKHKENIAIAKSKASHGLTQATEKTSNMKRKQIDSDSNTHEGSQPSHKKIKLSQTSSLPPDFFDSGVSLENQTVEESVDNEVEERQPAPQQQSVSSKLPIDFFDVKQSSNHSATTRKLITAGSTSKSLPEGFFDDPKQDAKARKVEYKDPTLEEWEKFQKSIQKEDDVSDALVQVLDVESKEEREVSEVQEQVSCYLKAESLRKKQEQLIQSKQTMTPIVDSTIRSNDADETSSSDELDFDELFNWRSKIS